MPFKKLLKKAVQVAKPFAAPALQVLAAKNPVLGMAVGAFTKAKQMGVTAADSSVVATHPTQAVVSSGVTAGGMVRTRPGGEETGRMYRMGRDSGYGTRIPQIAGKMGPSGAPKPVPPPRPSPPRGDMQRMPQGPAGPGRTTMGGGYGGTVGDAVRAAKMGGGGIVSVNGIVRGVVALGGKWLPNKKVVALAKRIGLEAAGIALGVGLANVATMVATDSAKTTRGRRRGITWRELSTTRRTMRRLNSMSCYIKQAPTRSKRVCR